MEGDGSVTGVDAGMVAEVRRLCADQLAAYAEDAPDVVGDLRIWRFCLGHNRDVTKAAKMFGKMLAWREEQGMKELRERLVAGGLSMRGFSHEAEVLAVQPMALFGPDKLARNGDLVTVEYFGHSDGGKTKGELGEKKLLQFGLELMETRSVMLDRMSREQGRLACMCRILDMSGYTLAQVDPAVFSMTGKALWGDYYPELLGRVEVINTPWTFDMAFSVAKPMLAQRTVDKITVTRDADRAKCEKRLAELVDLDVLPETLPGGRGTEGILDPEIAKRHTGGVVGAERIEVAKAEIVHREVPVGPGDVVSWSFKVADGNVTANEVSYSVSFKAADLGGGGAVVIPLVDPTSVTSAMGVLEGDTVAMGAGSITFTLDNKAAWIYGKTVFLALRRASAPSGDEVDDA